MEGRHAIVAEMKPAAKHGLNLLDHVAAGENRKIRKTDAFNLWLRSDRAKMQIADQRALKGFAVVCAANAHAQPDFLSQWVPHR